MTCGIGGVAYVCSEVAPLCVVELEVCFDGEDIEPAQGYDDMLDGAGAGGRRDVVDKAVVEADAGEDFAKEGYMFRDGGYDPEEE